MEARVSTKKIWILAVQEPKSHNTITEVQINRQRDDIINYWNNRKRRKSYSRAEGLRVLRLMLEPFCYRVGSILNAVPDSLRRPFESPCTAGSREMLGSQLRKHISTWSATACARARPSSSRRLSTASSSWDISLPAESRRGSTTLASGAASPPRIGLKPKDARAASA
jgi:hypothetical protein